MSTPKNAAKAEKDEFLGHFWKLSNPDDIVRISASQKIVESLSRSQENHQQNSQNDEENWSSDVNYAIGRLLQGLASERKASRLGFSCTLTHLLAKLDVKKDSTIQKLLSMMEEKLKSSNDKGAEKGVLLGKVFALLAIIQSCELEKAPSSVKIIFDGLLKLSKTKSYMKPVCFHGISELIKKVPNDIFDKVLWGKIGVMLSKGWEDCDAESFDILQTCQKCHPETCGKTYLKTNNWIGQKSKKLDLIGVHSYKYLGKMLPDTTICHPRIHPLCYEVVENVAKSDNDTFKKFWKEAIENGLLESSPERKYLALKLSIHILPMLSDDQIPIVWSSSLVTILMHIFSNKSSPLHTVCKTEIVDEICEKMKSEKMIAKQQLSLLFQFLTSPAGLFLDDNTNTRCLQALAGSLNLEALQKYISWLRNVFITGKLDHEGIKEVTLDTARRWSLSQLSQLTRNHRLPKEDNWLLSTIQFLFVHYHFVVPSKKSKAPGCESIDKSFEPITDKTREHLKHCLEPALNAMNSIPSLQKSDKKDAAAKFHGTASDGEFWISKLIKYANTLMIDYKMKLVEPLDDKSQELWNEMLERLEKILQIEESNRTRASEGTALRLLLAHIGIRLLNSSEEEKASAHEVLSDLFQVVDERFADVDMENGVQGADSEVNWVEVVIETILNMLSQNSRSIRSVADQVFKLLSAQLTRKGLHLILDVLDPTRSKEILKGDDGLGEDGSDGGDDVEGEASDGEEVEEEDSSDSDDSAFDDADVSDENVEDRNQFREKVKEALGNAAPSSDEEDDTENNAKEEESDDSGPELDDEAMMRIDSILSDVFRQKKMTKRKLQEDSHKQLLVFQLRCLDLIEIMASKRHPQETDDDTSDSLVLEAVRPLLTAIQHASRKATDMTLAEKASVLLRVKICKMKRYPKNLSEDTISRCHDDIEAIMAVAYKAQSVFICQLASDCCLFLLRVLCGNTLKDNLCSEETALGVADKERIHKVYKAALENFMTHRESHLQPCVIQDYIARFPAMAAELAPDLLKYVKDGVQIYRRSRACFMLHELLKSQASREKCKSFLFQITSVANELVERTCSSGNLKTKCFVEVMRLYHQAVLVLQATEKLKSLNKSVLTSPLEQFLELEDVTKSQELTNWTWKVLHVFGIEKSASGAAKKKVKKRKKRLSESENVDDDSKKTKDEKLEKMDVDETKTESKKELKARILKEKKERKRKKTEKKNKKEEIDGEQKSPKETETKKNRKKKKADHAKKEG